MTCPVCRLENPPGAGRCDCGYDFKSQSGGVRPSSFAQDGIFYLLAKSAELLIGLWVR